MMNVVNETTLKAGNTTTINHGIQINKKQKITQYVSLGENTWSDDLIKTLEKRKLHLRGEKPLIRTDLKGDYSVRIENKKRMTDMQGACMSALKAVFITRYKRSLWRPLTDMMKENQIECHHVDKDTTNNTIENLRLTRHSKHGTWDCVQMWNKLGESKMHSLMIKEHELCLKMITEYIEGITLKF